MRRFIIWVIALLIAFAIGVAIDSAQQYLATEVATIEPANVDVAEPTKDFPLPIATTPTPAATPLPNLILDYDPQKFVPLGTLVIMGPVPQGFSDFDCIQLDVPVGDDVDYHGYIAVYSGANSEAAPANFALVTERTLYFTTSPSQDSGFQYRFEGEFLVKDFDSVYGKHKAAVRGILTKSKDGQTIAEHSITLRIEFDDC